MKKENKFSLSLSRLLSYYFTFFAICFMHVLLLRRVKSDPKHRRMIHAENIALANLKAICFSSVALAVYAKRAHFIEN